MELKSLWIGESLTIISSGDHGTFEGIDKFGKAKLRVKNKMVSVEASDLSLRQEEEAGPILQFEDEHPKRSIIKKAKFQDFIDLHIEILAPHLVNAPPQRIIDFQISSFKTYLEEAHAARLYKITIIHGKGEGVLRSEISHLLDLDKKVKLKSIINDGGATEAFLG